ncbi:MAG: hypothetical protein IID17_13290 [Nitrospinae bacterium]|nr:hypothetical protein [Nitrospinota bacterium]
MQKTNDGGYILAGSLDSNGNTDFYVVKTDSSGNKIWGKTFGYSNRKDIAYSIQQTADDGFIVGGKSSLGSDVDPYYFQCF